MTIEQEVIPVAKAVNEELKQATFIVLSPDEVDLHGDTYDSTEVRKACHNFNKHCRKANLLHLVQTTSFDIIESYIAPVSMVLGNNVIKAGTWLAVLQVHDDKVWSDIKKGDLCGVSVGCKAMYENLED